MKRHTCTCGVEIHISRLLCTACAGKYEKPVTTHAQVTPTPTGPPLADIHLRRILMRVGGLISVLLALTSAWLPRIPQGLPHSTLYDRPITPEEMERDEEIGVLVVAPFSPIPIVWLIPPI